jgi:hypothetical protein
VTGEEWSQPQKDALAELYTIGAYAVFRQRRDALHALLTMQVCRWSSRARTPLWSREGYSPTNDSFAGVRQRIQSRPGVLARFLNDSRTVSISLCQFRLLVAYQLWCHDESPHAGFGECEIEDLEPMITALLQPEISSQIFGSFDPAQFARFVDRLTSPGYWQAGPIAEFLSRYPVHSQER